MKRDNFLRNEDGQISVDWTVLVAALMGVGLVVSAEVGQGLKGITDDYDGITTGDGMITMFVSNPDARTRQPVAGEPPQTCNAANPGNDKCVGKAGETPNGDVDGWGSGTKGKSDANGKGGKGTKGWFSSIFGYFG